MECQVGRFSFVFHWLVSLAFMDIINVCGDLFLQKYLACDYCKNRSLVKFNRLTVFEPRHEKTYFCHMRTTKTQISLHIHAV